MFAALALTRAGMVGADGSSGSSLAVAGGSVFSAGSFITAPVVQSAAPAPAGVFGGGGSGGGDLAAGLAVLQGSGALPASAGLFGYGPYGEGVYTPLDYPAMRFLGEGETLNNLETQRQQPINFKTLALGALLLWALKA